MININNVSLVGRLVRDPELRKTKNNQSVCSFTIACNRDFKPQNGPEADFIGCIAWNQSAEFLTKYTHKGDEVGVKGRIQTRSYDDQSGKKVYVTEVLVEHLCIDTSRAVGAKKEEPSQTYDSNYSNTPSLDISSDDLPFY